MTSLRLRGVAVRRGRVELLHGVDLDVAPGEWVTLVGPNGAGKTTLLRAVCGLLPYTGELLVDGCEARSLPRRQLARAVALVPQTPLVPPGMSVSQYVLLGRTPHLGTLVTESDDDLAAAAAAIERLELVAFADRAVDSLSGGERQRVVVARLLAQDAPVALLDEPTAALDVGHQQQVLDLVEQLRAERALTVVATMHDLTLAGQYGDRVALLVDGRLVADGPAAEVLTVDVVGRHYGARVRVLEGEHGPVVVPVRDPEKSIPTRGRA